MEGRGCEKLTKISEVRKSLVETTMRTISLGLDLREFIRIITLNITESPCLGGSRGLGKNLVSRCVVKLPVNIYIDSH